MQLSDRDIQEFIALHAAEFGEELSVPEARESAAGLIELYLLLPSPTPREIAKMKETEKGNGVEVLP